MIFHYSFTYKRIIGINIHSETLCNFCNIFSNISKTMNSNSFYPEFST